jgi:hypothetical protein
VGRDLRVGGVGGGGRPDSHVGIWVTRLGKREGEATLHKRMNLEVGFGICLSEHRVPRHVHVPLDAQRRKRSRLHRNIPQIPCELFFVS